MDVPVRLDTFELPAGAGGTRRRPGGGRRGVVHRAERVYGRLDPPTGAMTVFDAPRGRGPYGITTTPSGEVFYASLVFVDDQDVVWASDFGAQRWHGVRSWGKGRGMITLDNPYGTPSWPKTRDRNGAEQQGPRRRR